MDSLRLLELVKRLYFKPSLEGVRLICCQHIMESTFKMFLSLTELGLKLKDISVLGKCYSTSPEIWEEMRQAGINVSPLSFAFDSHENFDETYQRAVKTFYDESILNTSDNTSVIFLDDGGSLIKIANQSFLYPERAFGIEQTSSGYKFLKTVDLRFPVLNVARSQTKLIYESPLIALSAFREMNRRFDRLDIVPKEILVLGGGSIGQSMCSVLEDRYRIHLYDPVLTPDKNLRDLLAHCDVILGCTGLCSLPVDIHSHIKKSTTLVSVSSSDREFDAVHIRGKLSRTNNCHQDFCTGSENLLNGGFPINFYGSRNNIPLEDIQLTLALLSAAILESQTMERPEPSLIPLDFEIEREIAAQFTSLQEIKNLSNSSNPSLLKGNRDVSLYRTL